MLLTLTIISLILNIAVLAVIFTRKQANNSEEIQKKITESGDRLEKNIKEEFSLNRQELGASFNNFSQKLDQLILGITQNLNQVRESIEKRLELIQKDNSESLEKMRLTVDEKLQNTLEKRLGESFKQVSLQLEAVYKNLGEIKSLTTGVDTLRNVLTNIKTRGTWGEVQLGSLLEQILISEQYDKNVAVKPGSNDRVEFAIKLPGKDDREKQCWLPIDSKFPLEDYQRLLEIQKSADISQIEVVAKALENRVKGEAKYIFEKYIDPPHTTDFAILYLPLEGLYAEVTQNQSLIDFIQRQYRVTVAGPNTITALLNSLQMGFRVLTVEKRSSEVWAVLGSIRKEFGTFGELLDKTQKKLHEASTAIDSASSKSRNIVGKLNKVQNLSEPSLLP
ncbi:MAG: DNA recombination protein RmuC [Candidatus Shapirobacteria bacterium]|jgi:DNA recombination protein RmuC